jgi:cilia- and flagella-associated protein 57
VNQNLALIVDDLRMR